jgi:transglutaminase-like putative cysteine protease
MYYGATAMPILSIKHVTTYRYHQPVAFGEHRMMLRPRDDADQKVLHAALEITPQPLALTWTRDRFGNHVATAQFADRADELRFTSSIHLDLAPRRFEAADIADRARRYPFRYAAEERLRLKRFMYPILLQPELARWSDRFFDRDAPIDTHALLVGMTRSMRRTFKHVARHERGIQHPLRTVALGSGSCRDLAVLMIAALRARGLAARFVSGYMHLADEGDDDAARVTGGNTHAWLQVYIPDPGWVDLDPSAGIVGNANLIRVAVVARPRDAIPLQGTWYGSASDHLAMQVAVKVTTANRGTFRVAQS